MKPIEQIVVAAVRESIPKSLRGRSISPADRLSTDLGLDSLAQISLALSLAETLQIATDDIDLAEYLSAIDTVGDLIASAAALQQQAAHMSPDVAG